MARPKDADSEKTVDAILDAARDLLRTRDSAASPPSLRAIAKHAGVSLGTIQYYFQSRDELYEACLDGYYERLAELAEQLLESASPDADSSTATATIERLVAALYDWACSERNLIALRLTMNASRGELHPKRQGEFLGDFVHRAAAALEPYFEVDAFDARLSIQSAASTIVRFALMSDSELAWLTGLDADAAREETRGFVVRAVRRLVRPSDG